MAEAADDTLEAIREELFAMTRSLAAWTKPEDSIDENRGCRLADVTPPAALPCKAQPDAAKTGAAIATAIPSASGETLDDIRLALKDCRRCSLAEGRNAIVFGEGKHDAALLFVGEGPGEEEDRQARPFVGPAGQLLDKIIEAMGLNRGDAYIANVVKCRPPENRTPRQDEVAACSPFLERQIQAIRPKVICALGASAAQHLLKTDVPVSLLRGRFHDYQGIPVMATYHPAYLLRNPSAKKQVWEDVKKIMAVL